MTRKFWFLLLLVILCTLALPLNAQEGDEDQPTDNIISFDNPVEDTITDQAFFDLWRFHASKGDVILAVMTAHDGLAPLLGITAETATIIARSDMAPDGSRLADAEPNGTAQFEFEIPEDGDYTLVPTRVGNQDGTTTGSYSLLLRVSSASGTGAIRDTQDVTFRCSDAIVTTATTLDFSGHANVGTYRISVYGLDDFDPVIRVNAGLEDTVEDCSHDSQLMGGDELRFPGEAPLILADETAPEQAAQFSLSGGQSLDRVRVTIGSRDGAPGRYMVVLDGFNLAAAAQTDYLEIRLGPLASDTEMLAYMVKTGQNRIDPFMTLQGETEEQELVCDDAGRRGCEGVPAFTDEGVIFNDGLSVIGDRFTAGLRLAPKSTNVQELTLSSRAENATGNYAIVLIGELPERSD